jgi:anti-anti-sigma regulatory factor
MSKSQQLEHLSSEQPAVDVSKDCSVEPCVLNLAGKIDIGCAGELKDEFLKALQSGKRIQVEIGGLSDLDVTALQLLWAAKRATMRLGVDFAVSGEPAKPIQNQVAELGMEELGIFA